MSADDLLTRALSGCLRCVPGVVDGHWDDGAARTGCSVVLLPPGSVGGLDVRGGAPASREFALLDPCAMQPHVDAYLLTGGSAPGLACADGVVAALRAAGRGFATDHGPIPLVPAAALFDLGCGRPDAPTAAHGRLACEAALAATGRPDAALSGRAVDSAAGDADTARFGSASTTDVATAGAASIDTAAPSPGDSAGACGHGAARGRRGAGCGARVGKLRGHAHAEDGGLGQAGLVLDDGLAVSALAAVNAYGDVRDPRDGRLLAGTRDDAGALLDSASFLADGADPAVGFTSNTVLVVVVTNAGLDKPGATRLARMAQAGVARSISPCATSLDGDVVFAAGTGTHRASVDRVGALAAEVVAAAVLDALRAVAGSRT